MSYEDQCVAAVHDPFAGTRRCSRAATNLDPVYGTLIPVCSQHVARATRQFASRIEAALADLRVEVANHECDADKAIAAYEIERVGQTMRRSERQRKASLAYFIKCGEYIKIGASSSPAFRLNTIRNTGGVLCPPDLDLSGAELIATERGGFDRERDLHKKFAHLRHTGEWFTEAPELTDYINALDAAA